MNDRFEVSLDPARVQMDRVHGWLRETYWSPNVRRDVTERAFANSLTVGAYRVDTGDQVAVARAVTDYATFAWLADVYVEESCRGQGLAKRMIAALETHPELATLRRWVLATQTASEVYERLGYSHVEAGRYMIKRSDPSVWQEKN